ncbi:hypothetical protein ASJ34_18245 [Xanthomonas campestris pv. campestris]|nr:hypothetical protein ASJ34_18245 [Xanthomonas campestris pv. campestris]
MCGPWRGDITTPRASVVGIEQDVLVRPVGGHVELIELAVLWQVCQRPTTCVNIRRAAGAQSLELPFHPCNRWFTLCRKRLSFVLEHELTERWTSKQVGYPHTFATSQRQCFAQDCIQGGGCGHTFKISLY